ncbi:MAG: DUF1801 domain-containing protein [Myxococcota bacterium]
MRKRLRFLRKLILDTAKSTEGVGAIEETLRWGEPAYLTSESRSGSTIRIHWKEATPTQYRMYFNCNTSLVETFRSEFAGLLEFEGNRSIVFEADDPVPVGPLSVCIAMALTYHRSKGRLPV